MGGLLGSDGVRGGGGGARLWVECLSVVRGDDLGGGTCEVEASG